MKFITEEDLRDLYKKEPFMEYNLQEGERLTPGARQFLLDRGINLYDNDPFLNPGFKKTASSKGVETVKEEFDKQFEAKKQLWALEGIKAQLECMESSIADMLNEQLAEEISADLNHVINTLNRMIGSTEGGDECQRS